MNAPQEPHDAPGDKRIDLNRRTLTKSALAAPVIVGALMSRPVLGNSLYHCTVSGKLSGNTSSHGQPQPCNTVGLSPGCWKSPNVTGSPDGSGKYNASKWPSPYKPHTKYSKVFGTSAPAGFSTDSTLLTALNTGGGGDIALMRAAIASLLSAQYLGLNYPLTTTQVIQMYTATLGGGTIVLSTIFPGVTGNPSWNRDQVLQYFESLYGGENSLCPAGKP